MTLRKRILFFNLGTFLISLIIVGFIAYYEFKEQESRISKMTAAGGVESPAHEALEIVIYGGIIALIIAAALARIFLKKALQPIDTLISELENTDISNLSHPLPRSGNGDELDRLAVVFNRLKERLNLSFAQTHEFTMNASHELKTPLSIMYATLAQMMGDEHQTNTHREKLDSILEEVIRLTRISSQLAFLSKFDADQNQTAKEKVDLEILLREIVEDTAMISADRTIQVELRNCESAIVWGDRMMLRQMLLALADNAVKYNVDGGSIRMSLVTSESSAAFQIQNTGAVLTREQWPRIFERFFRGKTLSTDHAEGRGLGLSIAKAIVDDHHGNIAFTVEDEKWNSLEVRLPLAVGSKLD